MLISWEFIVLFCICGLFLIAFILILLNEIVNKCIGPKLLKGYKKKTNFQEVLAEMKHALEEEYPMELWENTKFYDKYLKLYKTFTKLRRMARREYNGKINLEDFIVFEELSPGGPGIHGNAYQSSFSTDMKPTDETFFQAIPKPEDKEELQHKSKQKPEIKEKPKGLNKFVIDFFGDVT